MAEKYYLLAMDYGAESGRGVLVTLNKNTGVPTVEMEEIHRLPNRPVRMGGTLYWDFPFLFAELLATLRKCAERGITLSGIGVDTWGVDFGLLGADDRLLGNPVHYRDSRTDGIHDYSNPVMKQDKVFKYTCCEPWSISSLFQVLAMQKQNSPLLPLATTFLQMPDLFNFFLTGQKASERSIASTGNLMGADGEWSREVIEAFKLPAMFGRMVEPGTLLGPLSEEVQALTGLGPVPVVATCGHDTSAVAAAVPAQGQNWSFLSSGTWSIVGKLRDKPVTTPEAYAQGFCNEYTLNNWFICRNILGLWLVQELKRKWDKESDPWDYNRITAAAAEVPSGPMLDVADGRLLAPADMEETLYTLLAELGQPKPESRGTLVRSVLESLALEYAWRLESLDAITDSQTESLYIVGGGVANKLLCQFTANACARPTFAGASECTALGNALTQAVGLGLLNGPDEIRQVMRGSLGLTPYEPQDAKVWEEKRAAYDRIKKARA